ncbi:MAG: hypothetical protein AB7G44_10610 [Bacteroidia bacterium]
MSSVLVAKFENKKDANFVASLIKKFRKNTKVFQGEAWEDLYLGEMIEEGMREKGQISEAEFSAFLDKKIKAAK